MAGMAARLMTQLPWKFTERPPGAVQTDPFEEEFFIGPSDNELDDGHVASLVRESVQNALDARVGSGPVRVRFALHEESVAAAGAIDYLAGLEPHLAVLSPPVPWPIAGGDSQIRWLVYEDFNTRGLVGDPAIYADDQLQPGSREDFYWFWRNIGRSAKSGENLGRWGLGKTVFPSSSDINCIIGLTRRADDNRVLLMGQAVLRNHTLHGRRFQPHGLLSDPDAPGDLPMPLEGDLGAKSVTQTFRLGRRGETGLSIVVPFVRAAITAEAIARSVCTHFFIRILRGELVAETVDEQGRSYVILADTIADVVKQVRWEMPNSQRRVSPPPLEMARLALDRLAAGSVDATLPLVGTAGAAAWTRELVPRAVAEPLAKSLALDGGVAIVKVPLALDRVDGDRVETHFNVVLRRRSDGKGEGWYARDGMTITNVNRSRPGGGDYEGLLLANDQVISSFLGDAEGPAHVEWSKEEKRLGRTWKTYAKRLWFVSSAIVRLAELLRENQPKAAPLALSKVFSVRMPSAAVGTTTPIVRKPEGISSKKEWYSIGPKGHGFTIRSVPNAPRPPAAQLRVTFAYDASSKNPFRLWSPLDFELKIGKDSTLAVRGKGVKPKLLGGNEVLLADLDESFWFTVEGFDSARDVVIRAVLDGVADEPAASEA